MGKNFIIFPGRTMKKTWVVGVILAFSLSSGCPDPRQYQHPLNDAGGDASDEDADGWNENWWWDFVNEDQAIPEYDHPRVVSFSPETTGIYRRTVPNFIVTFDRPMNTQRCMQNIEVKINPIGEPQRDWAGEWSWNAQGTTVTFAPLEIPKEGEIAFFSIPGNVCPSAEAEHLRVQEILTLWVEMDQTQCGVAISMTGEQDGMVIEGSIYTFLTSTQLNVGTHVTGHEIRTIITMDFPLAPFPLGIIPADQLDRAALQLVNAPPWGTPPSDIVLDVLPYSSVILSSQFDEPSSWAEIPENQDALEARYAGYDQSAFDVTQPMKEALERQDAGFTVRLRARDLLINGISNRAGYWAMEGPPSVAYWPNLYLCYWSSWRNEFTQ